MLIRRFSRQIVSAILTAATAVSSLCQSYIPAHADSTYTVSADAHDITYLFADNNNQEIGSVLLPDSTDISEKDVKAALDNTVENQDTYILSPEFYDDDGNRISLSRPLSLHVSGQEIRQDEQNVRIFALPEGRSVSEIESCGIKTVSDGSGTAKKFPEDTSVMAVAVNPVRSISASISGAEIAFAGLSENTEVSVQDNSGEDGVFSIRAEMDGVQYLPESVTVSGEGWEDAPDLILSAGNHTVALSGYEEDGSAVYPVTTKVSGLLKKSEKNGTLSFSLKAKDWEFSGYAAKTDTENAIAVESAEEERPVQGSILLHEGSTTQKEAMLAENELFLADKYITKQEEQINDQDTYMTTIEQAAYSNKIIRIAPPKKREILIAIDSSASMGDKVNAMNNAIDAFIDAVMKANQTRKERWDSGYYYGTEGDTLDNHLLSIRAIVKYNNKVTTLMGSPVTPMSESDVSRITGPAHLRNGYEPNGSLYDMTRTDLALAKLQTYITDPANSSVVLMSDGEPYGRGAEEALDYDTDSMSGLMITYENTNSALRTARSIKDNGSTVYSVYAQTGYPSDLIINAKNSMDIHKLATTSAAAGGQVRADQSLGCAVLSMISSDYPRNGQMHGTPDSKDSGDYLFTGTYDDPGEGSFGRYFKMPEEISNIVDDFVDIAKEIDFSTSFTDGLSGYAAPGSYLYDVISYPLRYNTSENLPITVYQVPRICTGTDAAGNRTFQWGDAENITEKVSASVQNERYITVKGYDYESNALSDRNKNLKENETETYPSKPGDYGYKLVTTFYIYANKTFGGNEIETNDSDVSGYYPADPSDGTAWKDNADRNPGGTKEVLLYPVPKVDLYVSYKIASDNVVLYAPQTAKIWNLVTDQDNQMFATDPAFRELKAQYDSAKKYMEEVKEEYIQAGKRFQETAGAGGIEEGSSKEHLVNAINSYNDALQKYDALRKSYERADSYIPDGDNNAFVDIHYVLSDPDGEELATLDIPHGTNCEKSSPSWKLKGTDPLIRKHGSYTITATVTPVNTTREESHTGSSSEGSQKPLTVSVHPTAHIYTLQITGTDSGANNLDPIGIQEDTIVNLDKLDTTSWIKDSVGDWKWIGLDGSTPEENKDAKPGADGFKTAGGKIPGLIVYAPDKTHVSGVNGSYSAKGASGDYIPVAIKMFRQLGDVNKGVEEDIQNTMQNVPMNDNDGIYIGPDGKRVSSVSWKHQCEEVADCDTTAFAEGSAKNNTEDDGYQVNVRYLIHIKTVILPHPGKKTNPMVKRGDDLSWTITVPNTDTETNPDRLPSDSYLVDVLPYNGDGRQDPDTKEDSGSSFTGDLYYKTLTVQYQDAATALDMVKKGTKGIFYSSDDAVRTAEKDGFEMKNINWKKADYTIQGTDISAHLPIDAKAIKVDTYLLFGDTVIINMTAALQQAGDQNVGDTYLNTAYAFSGNDRIGTNTTRTQVSTAYISGIVWEDSNANGIQDTKEPAIRDVKVGLYVSHNEYGGPSAALSVDGQKFDKAYDADSNIINEITTNEDGAYQFDNLKSGTYYVIAQNLDGKYTITQKHAVSNSEIDSDAEETMPVITNYKNPGITAGHTTRAWIPGISVTDTGNRSHMDIGLIVVTGSVNIKKTLDQIAFPSTMTEEERAVYYPTFHYTLTGPSGEKYYTTTQMNQNRLTAYASFADLPIGTYTLTEEPSVGYKLDSVLPQDLVQTDLSARSVTFTITAEKRDFEVSFHNTMTGESPMGDQNQVINHIPMHIPVRLQVHYTGPSRISDRTKVSYTFPADQVKGTVTYDDGSTAEVILGQTPGYTIDPMTVTNVMNTGNGRLPVHGYYTEKGVTLEDSFSVAVDLKPVHKFQLNFDANGSTYTDGTSLNSVMFVYDSLTDTNTATSGVYKDIANGLLRGRGSDYAFAGWNTKKDGTGIQYDDFSSLSSLGADTGITSLTLYANWRVSVTFNAGAGIITGGVTQAEKAVSGRASGSVRYSVGQTAATGLLASKADALFCGWNTSASGSGTDIENYGAVTKPVTFYAVYAAKSYDFAPVEREEVFTAPIAGTWKLEVWGSYGGGDSSAEGSNVGNGGYGGYVSGTIHLDDGEKLYVNVGTTGHMYARDGSVYSYNGGGHSHGYTAYNNGQAAGGGATSICRQSGLLNDVMNRMIDQHNASGNWSQAEKTILAVAGGGGAGIDEDPSYSKNGESAHPGGTLIAQKDIVLGKNADVFGNDVVGAGGGIRGGKQYQAGGWNYHSPLLSNVTDALADASHRTPHYLEKGYVLSLASVWKAQFGYARITYIGN